MTDEMFIAGCGKGAYLNSKPIAVRRETDITKVYLGFAYGKTRSSRENLAQLLSKLSPLIGGYRIYNSTALELACVAAGRLDGVIAMDNSPWDCAAGVLLIQEAGGVVTDLKGDPYRENSGDIIATTSALYTELLNAYPQAHIGLAGCVSLAQTNGFC